ncbi:MAG: 30S ribosomal protein S20 [candidate division KSB1 bacterium]|nr:30S ribosomal protein S20 [candidate division KSB1 bacterium]MDZ7367098.1 30S ribosomal protein S20 [candidate division KSB1 bacterium]MDZ7405076.1 30S ribosomal protein S20 [candidate division KSB1 bacterium]
MATHQSAIKRNRQAKRRALRNKQYRSKMRTMIKKVLAATDRQAVENDFKKTVSLLDKLVTRGVIHQNNAANQKSRLSKFFNSLPAAATT